MTKEELDQRLAVIRDKAIMEGVVMYRKKRGQNIEEINTIAEEEGVLHSRKRGTNDETGTHQKIAVLNNVSEITDEDFVNPTRSIQLPPLPDNVLTTIRKKSKPVLLKKNFFEKNLNNHKELSPDDSRKILDAALYHSERIIQDKPSEKPNYWVMAKIDGKSSIVTIEISETKENYEIVGWRFASMKSIQQIKNRAEREGGQVLVTESNAQGSSGLHDLSSGNINNIPQSGEKSSDNLEFRKKRLYRKINPIVRDGRVRNEYADLLENKKYTPEKIADWQEKAFEWILKRGGIVQAAEDFLADKAPSDGHIAELA